MEKKRTHRIQIALDDAENEWVEKEADANGFDNPQQYARHAMKRFPELQGALLRFNAIVEQKEQLEKQVDQLTKEKNAAVSQLRDVESRLRSAITEREGYKANVEVAEHNLKQSVDVQEQLKQHAADTQDALARLEKMVTPKRCLFARK